MSSIPHYVPNVGLSGPDHDLFVDLYVTWQEKRPRNLLRTIYHDGKNALKDFGISVPPQMQVAYTPLQWISKGVRALTGRSQFEGFVSGSGSEDIFGLLQILDENDFVSEFQMAKKSSAIHACSFLTVTSGDVASGEPEVLVLPRAADSAGAVWDRRRRALRGFLSVISGNDDGPTEMVMYTPELVYSIVKRSTGWVTTSWPHNLREVPAVRLPYSPELNRPFGHSRISRTAMGLTDAAVRTILRAEVSAEFYSADKYWLFGADVSKFIGDDKWSALMGRMNAIDVDTVAGEKVDLQRFSGASPQPHADQLRMLASQFADDQNLDVKWADASNPSSADAIYAAKEDLIMETRDQNQIWGRGAVKAMQLAVRLRDNLGSETTPELRSLSAQFTDPAIVSPSARSNAFVQLASSITGFGETEVGMEYAGLTREQIVRLQAERRRSGVMSLVQSLRGAADAVPAEVAAVAGQRGDGE